MDEHDAKKRIAQLERQLAAQLFRLTPVRVVSSSMLGRRTTQFVAVVLALVLLGVGAYESYVYWGGIQRTTVSVVAEVSFVAYVVFLLGRLLR